MKVNAPEKIYLQENTTTDCYGEFWPEWFEARAKDSDIEYIRTDAFIKRAKKWFEKQNEWFDPNGNRHCDLNDFDDFKNYMKGE